MGGEFEYSPDCEATLATLKNWVQHRPQNKWAGDPSDKDFAVMVNHSIYIADDDPRFKGNVRYKGN
jgi:hypothetical protein